MALSSIETLSPNARVWVYQANRPFTKEESAFIKPYLEEKIGEWTAHGSMLKASLVLAENMFLIIALDEEYSMASGCSIDASVRWLQHIGQELSIDFLNRDLIFEENDTLHRISALLAKKAVQEGIIKPEMMMYNNSVQNLHDWKNNWKIAAKDSYLKRYFV